MTNTRTICLTVLLCWLSLMAVIVYALNGHTAAVVGRTTHVEVMGK